MLLAASAPPLLEDLAILVVAGSIIAYISQRIGTVPIVGFLIAGAAIGPNGFALVEDLELVEQAAELGVILLLFTIGIEFSLDRLRQLAGLILGGGSIQVALTTAIIAGLLLIADTDWQTAVYTGLLVSLSSTAIVLKLLADRRTTTSPTGRVAVSFLIFQDLAVVAMVLVVPMLGGDGGGAGDLAWAIGKALLIVVAVLIAARTAMPRLLETVARTCSAEIFLLTIIAVCFGTAYLTSLLDVSVSLGAFLAGLMVSESRLSEQALGDILPLQILFSATFFVSVGMLLDLDYVIDNLLLVLGFGIAIVIIKFLATAVAAAVMRRPRSVYVSSAIVLAQVGEFSFVLERAGAEVGLVPGGLDNGSDAFIAITVFLMILTPFGIRIADVVADRLRSTDSPSATVLDVDTPVHGQAELQDHVVIAGYGTHAKTVARSLDLAGVPYVITTLDPDAGREAEEEGRRVVPGDIVRRFISEEAGISLCRLVVIADDDAARVHQVAAVAKGLNPVVPVLARVATTEEAAELQASGICDHVVADDFATADALVAHTLGRYAMSERLIDVIVEGAVGTAAVIPSEAVLDPDAVVHTRLRPDDRCGHLDQVRAVRPGATGCQQCLADGTRWVHLRLCLICGYVGCCDSSPGRHASAHFHDSGHALMRSAEPGENWAWCFEDRVMLEVLPGPGDPAEQISEIGGDPG
ncbi:MAG: cation:proton antiporter [Actinomycetota bacterium]